MACLRTSGTRSTLRGPSQWRLTRPGEEPEARGVGLGVTQQRQRFLRTLLRAEEDPGRCGAPPHTDQPPLSPQVPLHPLPPVSGHALVPPHGHLLVASAQTRPRAPLVSKGPGDPCCAARPCPRGSRGCAPVSVLCARLRSRLLGSSRSHGRHCHLACSLVGGRPGPQGSVRRPRWGRFLSPVGSRGSMGSGLPCQAVLAPAPEPQSPRTTEPCQEAGSGRSGRSPPPPTELGPARSSSPRWPQAAPGAPLPSGWGLPSPLRGLPFVSPRGGVS